MSTEHKIIGKDTDPDLHQMAKDKLNTLAF